jgi:hypothetical protein
LGGGVGVSNGIGTLAVSVEFAFVLEDVTQFEPRLTNLLRKAKYGCVSLRVWCSSIGFTGGDDSVKFVEFEDRDERVLFQLLSPIVPFQRLTSPEDLRNGK